MYVIAYTVMADKKDGADSTSPSHSLAVLPIVAGLQLPDTGVLSIFRMTAAGLSVVTALIARDQALALYWAPLQQREATSTRWL
jgi:hypothetical protein